MIRVIGDGIAGLSCALALRNAGAEVALEGRGELPPRDVTALVHPFAGRSMRLTRLDEHAWELARRAIAPWAELGWAREVEMVRPLVGEAGRRLLRSYRRDADVLERQYGVRLEEDERWGQSIVYPGAFAVEMRAALEGLRAEFSGAPSQEAEATVIAVGPALSEHAEVEGVANYGGQLCLFDLPCERAVSVAGLHVAPTLGGRACVGSTFWPADAPLTDAAAAWELSERLRGLGFAPGTPVEIWQGVRCVYRPDRRPLVGWAGKRRIVAGALGTRGWFWAPLVAQTVVELFAGHAPEPGVDLARATMLGER